MKMLLFSLACNLAGHACLGDDTFWHSLSVSTLFMWSGMALYAFRTAK
jgi:hypothetical protein